MVKVQFSIDTSFRLEMKNEELVVSPLLLHQERAPSGTIQYGGDVEFDTLIIDFPPTMMFSPENKFVEVRSALCINYEGPEPRFDRGIVINSDIVQNYFHGDRLLTLANEDYNIKREVQIQQVMPNFHLWVQDQRGHILDLHPNKNRLILQFEITY
jgi:hypothetical protein